MKRHHELMVATDQRDEAIAVINRRFDWDGINARSEALCSALNDTETVLLDMPAPDGEALLWKVERLYHPGEGIWSEGVEDQTYSDLRRFLQNGRA